MFWKKKQPKKQQILPSNEGSICYSASMSSKKENEDTFVNLSVNGLHLFAVADGLGSYSAAADASRYAIDFIRKNADKITPDRAVLSQIFQDIASNLHRLAEDDKYKGKDRENLLGTTLIVGIESAEEVTFAYLGNGAIIHVRGSIGDFPQKNDPWYAVSLLNPHTVPEKGKEALYRLLSDDESVNVKPTIISVSKDDSLGDAFIICTDGIYSADQIELFRHQQIGLLIKFDEHLLSLYDLLRKLQSDETDNRAETLKTEADLFLESNKAKFDDDATLAILLTSKFYKKK
ncbi:MAG: protein phosphatase 2C domain-containing protein [Prevotellaceae bacterium]|jgi:serine/threonine protein phosphatase PrpC|nr:protein phosphatase 2C domain-containing protein [Prevotellaceae bacterium]